MVKKVERKLEQEIKEVNISDEVARKQLENKLDEIRVQNEKIIRLAEQLDIFIFMIAFMMVSIFVKMLM